MGVILPPPAPALPTPAPRGHLATSRDIFVVASRGGVLWYLVDGARGAAKHSTVHRTSLAPKLRTLQPTMTVVLRLRKPKECESLAP